MPSKWSGSGMGKSKKQVLFAHFLSRSDVVKKKNYESLMTFDGFDECQPSMHLYAPSTPMKMPITDRTDAGCANAQQGAEKSWIKRAGFTICMKQTET